MYPSDSCPLTIILKIVGLIRNDNWEAKNGLLFIQQKINKKLNLLIFSKQTQHTLLNNQGFQHDP